METKISSKKDGFIIRRAEERDAALLLDFIRRLADYEKRLQEVVATEEDI